MKKLTEPRNKKEMQSISEFIEQKFDHKRVQEEIYKIFEKGYRIIPNRGNSYDDFFTLAGSWEIWAFTPIGFYFKEHKKNEHIDFGEKRPFLSWQLRPRHSYDYLALSSEPEQDEEKYPVGYPHLTLDFKILTDGPYRSFDYVEHGGYVKSRTEDISYSLENSVCISRSSPLPQRFFSNLIEPHCQKGFLTGNGLMMDEYAKLGCMSTAVNIAAMYLNDKSNHSKKPTP